VRKCNNILGDVFGEATIQADAASFEVLTHERLTTTAEEAFIALRGGKEVDDSGRDHN
jgi:hypothetical protein